MIEIRWVVRGGVKVLQYRYDVVWSDWQDVPTVEAAEGEQIEK